VGHNHCTGVQTLSFCQACGISEHVIGVTFRDHATRIAWAISILVVICVSIPATADTVGAFDTERKLMPASEHHILCTKFRCDPLPKIHRIIPKTGGMPFYIVGQNSTLGSHSARQKKAPAEAGALHSCVTLAGQAWVIIVNLVGDQRHGLQGVIQFTHSRCCIKSQLVFFGPYPWW